jgi:hypothetical protein
MILEEAMDAQAVDSWFCEDLFVLGNGLTPYIRHSKAQPLLQMIWSIEGDCGECEDEAMGYWTAVIGREGWRVGSRLREGRSGKGGWGAH